MSTTRLYTTQLAEAQQVSDEGIAGLAVATIGEARGHGVWFGETAMQQLEKEAERLGKLKVRWGHVPLLSDPVGTEIGTLSNFQRKGDKLLGDLTFVKGWEESELIKSKVSHLKVIALNSPELMALSIEFIPSEELEPTDKENTDKLPEENLKELRAVAITSDGAVTPEGLFSQITDNLMSFFKPKQNKEQSEEKQFNAQVTLENGNVLNLPETTPTIGDPVQMLDSDGNEVDASGTFQSEGYFLEIADGVVKSITLGTAESTDEPADEQPAEEESQETQESAEAGETQTAEHSTDNEQETQLQTKVEELEAQLKQMSDKQPADLPPGTYPPLKQGLRLKRG